MLTVVLEIERVVDVLSVRRMLDRLMIDCICWEEGKKERVSAAYVSSESHTCCVRLGNGLAVMRTS